jgi:hypothetical protein
MACARHQHRVIWKSRQRSMSTTGWTILLAVLLVLTVVLGVVVLLLEQPSRVARLVRSRRWSVLGLGVSVVAIVGVVMGQGSPNSFKSTSSLPSGLVPLASVLREVKAADGIRTVPAHLVPPLSEAVTDPLWNLGFPPLSARCQPERSQSRVPACGFGDRTGSHTMVLYGDSHAGMWFQAIDDIATRAHWRLIVLFKPACPADPLPTRFPRTPGEWAACDKWHRFAINRINRTDPDLLIISQNITGAPNGVNYTATQWQLGMELLLRKLTVPKTVKLVLGDIPWTDGPDCLARHVNDVQACRGARFTLYGEAERNGAVAEGARYVDVTPWFCAKTCSPVIGDYDVYFNLEHVSLGYSRFLEGVMAQTLDLSSFR